MIFNQMGVFSERVGVVKQTYAPPPSFLNSSYLPSPLPPAEKKILYETMVCVCVCVCVCPADWSDAVLVPIPKKGDLTQCDNWRGIALLDVVEGSGQGHSGTVAEVGRG